MKINMSENTKLNEEILTEQSYSDFSQKVTEESDLRNELAAAMRENNLTKNENISNELEMATFQRIELEEKWLRLQVESTKARRDFQSRNDRDFDMLEQLSPNFNKAVWEAEDELERHLKRYSKE